MGVFVAKGVAFGKELYVAGRLGVGEQLDVFLIANLFPAFLIGIFAGTSQTAFVPEYMACRARVGVREAHDLVSQMSTWMLIVLAGAALLSWPVAQLLLPTVASGFGPGARHVVSSLLPLLILTLVFCGLATLWAGVLNAEGKFGFAAFVPVVTPLCVVLAIGTYGGSSGSVALALGTAMGGLVELGLMYVGIRSLGFRPFGMRVQWDQRLSRISVQFISLVGAGLLMSLTLLVDQSFAARLEVGSVSLLSYGTRLGAVISSISVMVVSTLALPVMSRIAAREEWARLERAFLGASGLLFVCTTAVALVLALESGPIVDAVFQRGAFSAEDAVAAARIQLFHVWHIPFYVVGTLALRVLHALRMAHVAVLGSAINLTVDVATNMLAVPALGVAGVALATTFMYAASCLYLGFVATRELRRRQRALLEHGSI